MVASWMAAYFEQEKVKKTNNKTPVGETRCLCIFCFLFIFGHCLISPALHPGFSDLWGMLSHARGHPHSFLGKQRISLWGGNHSKDVPLPTCLAWLQPIYYNSRFLFIHVKTAKILLVVKTLIKNRAAAAKLISSHKI